MAWRREAWFKGARALYEEWKCKPITKDIKGRHNPMVTLYRVYKYLWDLCEKLGIDVTKIDFKSLLDPELEWDEALVEAMRRLHDLIYEMKLKIEPEKIVEAQLHYYIAMLQDRLRDIEKAYERGEITREEYEQYRREVLEDLKEAERERKELLKKLENLRKYFKKWLEKRRRRKVERKVIVKPKVVTPPAPPTLPFEERLWRRVSEILARAGFNPEEYKSSFQKWLEKLKGLPESEIERHILEWVNEYIIASREETEKPVRTGLIHYTEREFPKTLTVHVRYGDEVFPIQLVVNDKIVKNLQQLGFRTVYYDPMHRVYVLAINNQYIPLTPENILRYMPILYASGMVLRTLDLMRLLREIGVVSPTGLGFPGFEFEMFRRYLEIVNRILSRAWGYRLALEYLRYLLWGAAVKPEEKPIERKVEEKLEELRDLYGRFLWGWMWDWYKRERRREKSE